MRSQDFVERERGHFGERGTICARGRYCSTVDSIADMPNRSVGQRYLRPVRMETFHGDGTFRGSWGGFRGHRNALVAGSVIVAVIKMVGTPLSPDSSNNRWHRVVDRSAGIYSLSN